MTPSWIFSILCQFQPSLIINFYAFMEGFQQIYKVYINRIIQLTDIEKINRAKEIPKSGLFCDLMWADPVDNDNGKLEGLTKTNDARGCSYYFGYELAKGFLKKNGLLSVIRAHQAQANGFKMYHWGGQKQFPTVITIFSAPNYCDFYNNKGAVIKFKVVLI